MAVTEGEESEATSVRHATDEKKKLMPTKSKLDLAVEKGSASKPAPSVQEKKKNLSKQIDNSVKF